jgi:NADH-quinone oxidoreductase subunit G
VTVIGPGGDLTYDYTHAGTDAAALAAFAARAGDPGKPALVIVGQGALQGDGGAGALALAMHTAEAMRAGLLVLHTAAARVGAMDVGATCDGGMAAALDGAGVVYSLGVDEVDIPAGPVVIYQGSHGDRGAHRADIILPAAAWVEENGLFVNTEGRPQLALRAGFPPGEAKENWAILRALSAEAGVRQPWDSLAALRRALVAAHPHLGRIDSVPENPWTPVPDAPVQGGAFRPAVSDFYLTNPIARASALMGELSALAAARRARPLAAE